jgi:hypothetical protein
MNIQEFCELDEGDILEWWTNNKLPHPGCPISFKMVCNLVWVCHRVNHQLFERRLQAFRETIGQVIFEGTKGQERILYFGFPFKDKTLLVPYSDDRDYWTDLQLVLVNYCEIRK